MTAEASIAPILKEKTVNPKVKVTIYLDEGQARSLDIISSLSPSNTSRSEIIQQAFDFLKNQLGLADNMPISEVTKILDSFFLQ